MLGHSNNHWPLSCSCGDFKSFALILTGLRDSQVILSRMWTKNKAYSSNASGLSLSCFDATEMAWADLSYTDEICKTVVLPSNFCICHAIDHALCLLLGLDNTTASVYGDMLC